LKYGALAKDIKVVKDRVVTRWEPSQYDGNGRKLGADGKPEPVDAKYKAKMAGGGASAALSSATAQHASRMAAAKKPIAPPPLHAPRLKKGAENIAVAASDAHTDRTSKSRGTSAGTAVSIETSAPLHGKMSMLSTTSSIASSALDSVLYPTDAHSATHPHEHAAGDDMAAADGAAEDFEFDLEGEPGHRSSYPAQDQLDDDRAGLESSKPITVTCGPKSKVGKTQSNFMPVHTTAAPTCVESTAADIDIAEMIEQGVRERIEFIVAEKQSQWDSERAQLEEQMARLQRELLIATEEIEDAHDRADGIEEEVRML
jgi:hypothetical protein